MTIDKPPLGFWLQVASAKLLGFTPFSILLPQALAGVLSVGLLYHLVRRRFGVVAGLLAALALAVSPISVVTNRNNTIDSTLALIMLLGAWAVMRAAETGKLRFLLLCALSIGIGFNVKMLEAYLVVPAYALLYLLAAPHRLRTRIGHLVVAGALMLAISLSWVTAVDLTPASLRPWVGSTQNNSELSLALGYNGVDRLLGMFGGGHSRGASPTGTTRSTAATSTNATSSAATGSALAGAASGAATSGTTTSGTAGTTAPSSNASGGATAGWGNAAGPFPPGGPGGSGGMFGTGTPGPLRLFQQSLGGQIGWILPMAVLGAVALAWQRRPRIQKDRQQQSLIVWGGWLVTMGVFFSVAGFFHPYYLTVLAPAVAALFGIGVVTLWKDYRLGGRRGWLLPVALAATAGEQAYLLSAYPSWARWMTPLVALLVGFGVVALIGARVSSGLGSAVRPIRLRVAVIVAVLALLIAPAVWAGIPVIQDVAAGLPSAGPTQTGRPRGFGGGPTGSDASTSSDVALASYLVAHRGTATYLVAVCSSNQADSLILATNQPVMALGGFSGTDPILTVDEFAQLVESGEVRYALVSTGGLGGPGGGQQSAITQWIEADGTAVPSSQWGGSTGTGRFGGGETLYDLNA